MKRTFKPNNSININQQIATADIFRYAQKTADQNVGKSKKKYGKFGQYDSKLRIFCCFEIS
jgi:hypothetical protein